MNTSTFSLLSLTVPQCCQGVKPELFLHPVSPAIKYLIRPRMIAQLRHFDEAEFLTLNSLITNLFSCFFMPML